MHQLAKYEAMGGSKMRDSELEDYLRTKIGLLKEALGKFSFFLKIQLLDEERALLEERERSQLGNRMDYGDMITILRKYRKIRGHRDRNE